MEQQQDSIENFCHKIRQGKQALKTNEFMIIARIESLILEKGMEDALTRAFAYVEAGASGIMIHSRRKEPALKRRQKLKISTSGKKTNTRPWWWCPPPSIASPRTSGRRGG